MAAEAEAFVRALAADALRALGNATIVDVTHEEFGAERVVGIAFVVLLPCALCALCTFRSCTRCLFCCCPRVPLPPLLYWLVVLLQAALYGALAGAWAFSVPCFWTPCGAGAPHEDTDLRWTAALALGGAVALLLVVSTAFCQRDPPLVRKAGARGARPVPQGASFAESGLPLRGARLD
jgi:hypothetical protein